MTTVRSLVPAIFENDGIVSVHVLLKPGILAG